MRRSLGQPAGDEPGADVVAETEPGGSGVRCGSCHRERLRQATQLGRSFLGTGTGTGADDGVDGAG